MLHNFFSILLLNARFFSIQSILSIGKIKAYSFFFLIECPFLLEICHIVKIKLVAIALTFKPKSAVNLSLRIVASTPLRFLISQY